MTSIIITNWPWMGTRGTTKRMIMGKGQLDFNCLEDPKFGYLCPEDVKLFYYDVCFEIEQMGISYIWDEEVESYLKQNSITIETKKTEEIPEFVGSNTIFFTKCSRDKQNKAASFCRHLRNSFAHFSVITEGDVLTLKDKYKDKKNKKWVITMIGNIERKHFNAIFDIFFKQKAQAENEYQQYINPEI